MRKLYYNKSSLLTYATSYDIVRLTNKYFLNTNTHHDNAQK